MTEPAAAGWDSITAALTGIYGDQVPTHFGTLIKYSLGGPDPLDGISIYRSRHPVPHLHYVTYGFSELYDKVTDDPGHSGFGFELTFRLAHDPAAEQPPAWPAGLMQNLARYVFQTGNAFGANHHLPLNGPISLDHPTDLTAAALIPDPELGTIDTPHGRLQFLQLVGLCGDEYELVRAGRYEDVLREVLARHPLGVTDLDRRCLAADLA